MNKDAVQKVTDRVYRDFPEMKGIAPKVTQAKSTDAPPSFTLTYNITAEGPGGRAIPRFVRVVADPTGKIIRISTSR